MDIDYGIMAKEEIYCQKSGCRAGNLMNTKGGIIVNESAYCSSLHGNVPDNSTPYLKPSALKRAVRKGQLTQYKSLENSALE